MEQEPRKVRYAVVGLGNIAQKAVLPAFEHAANSELVALISGDAEKMTRLALDYGVVAVGGYDDMEEVIRGARVDAVYLTVPNAQHRKYTERAARAGAHVLCEKPMAMTVEDCEAMLRVTREHRVKLMIAYRLHFERANLRAIARIEAGEIGDARAFSSVFSHRVRPGDIRTRSDAGGGALFDLGIYCVNAARYLFRDEPIEVQAMQIFETDERSRDVDVATSAILRFPENRIAQFTVSQGAANVSQFRVVGTKGDLELDPAYDYEGELEETLTIGDEHTTTKESEGDQFAPELVHFSECILTDREPEPSGRQGLADVRILRTLVESARTGEALSVEKTPQSQRPNERLSMKRPPVRRVRVVRAPSPTR